MSDSPYPGLRPFRYDESDIFFGRDEHIEQLAAKLESTKFLAVVGPSGSGKSSLVQTGLLAELLDEREELWRAAKFRPGNQPYARLASALLTDGGLEQNCPSPFAEQTESASSLREKLEYGPQALHRLLSKNPLADGAKLLIAVDQFEEIFRYYKEGDIDEAIHFVGLLQAASKHPDVHIIITMRSDFLEECSLFYELSEAVNRGLFITPRLTRDELREAIVAPAELYGARITSDLVNDLLNDMGHDLDRLPLMQHVLMRIWHIAREEPRDSAGRIVLDASHYEQAGKLSDALPRNAEEAYQELNDVQCKIAGILFRGLTEQHEGGRYIRSPLKLAEAADLAGVPTEQICAIVEKFRKEGRNFLLPLPEEQANLDADSMLDISHESLIRQWQRLQKWAEEEAKSADIYRRVEETARLKTQGEAELWKGLDLGNALAWQEREKPGAVWAKRYGKNRGEFFDAAIGFLEASAEQQQAEQRQAKEAQQRELQRLRKQKRWAIFAGSIVTMLALWIYSAKQQVEQAALGLVESQISYAASLARAGDYAKSTEILHKTYALQAEKLPAPVRHKRNLAAWFNKLMGGTSQKISQVPGKKLHTAAVSADGRLLAAGSGEELLLFDVQTGTLLQSLQGHGGRIKAAVFHPRGKWLAGAGEEKKIVFWSLPAKKQAATQIAEWPLADKISALAINAHGTVLAGGGYDSDIILWEIKKEIKTGKILHALKEHKEEIAHLAFSPDGSKLASASYDGTARLWTVKTGEEPLEALEHSGNVRSLAFSPDGSMLATGSGDKRIRLWDVAWGEKIRELPGHQGGISALYFLPGGDLVSSGDDSSLRIWHANSGVTLRVLQGHPINAIAIDKAGRIFSAGSDGAVRSWQTDPSYQIISNLPGEPASAAISPDGNHVATGFGKGELCLYSLSEKHLYCTPEQAHNGSVSQLVFDAKGDSLASAGGGANHAIKLWRVSGHSLQAAGTFHSRGESLIFSIALSADGRTLAAGSYDGQIGLFSVGAGQKHFNHACDDIITSVSFNADGTRLLSGGKSACTGLWDINAGKLSGRQSVFDEKDIFQAALSPDGQWAAGIEWDGTIHLYAMAAPHKRYRLAGDQGRIIFSPDSRQIINIGANAKVRVLDLESHDELFSIRLPVDNIDQLQTFDFRCEDACRMLFPLTANELALYSLGKIYD
ncbi:MAG: AAA family ATPase [Gammaproteobacteria bacterium]|nr:AAA family ATPase [Gammaproteobacteria bacterium]